MSVEEILHEDGAFAVLKVTPRLDRVFSDWNLFIGHNGLLRESNLHQVRFYKGFALEEFSYVGYPEFIHVCGAFSYSMTGEAAWKIGRYCSLAARSFVMGERHPIEHVTTSSLTYDTNKPAFIRARETLLRDSFRLIHATVPTGPGPVIEHDVWIGQDANIQRGIRLGIGCVIGAGAVVTRDVPPYAIVGGAPARVLRMRFPDAIIERLLASRWWDYHPKYLFDYGTADVTAFLDRFEAAQRAGTLEPMALRTLTWPTLLAELQRP